MGSYLGFSSMGRKTLSGSDKKKDRAYCCRTIKQGEREPTDGSGVAVTNEKDIKLPRDHADTDGVIDIGDVNAHPHDLDETINSGENNAEEE